MEKYCEYCWKKFETTNPNKKYCCKEHAEKQRLIRDKVPRDRQCKYCGCTFQWWRHFKVCEDCLKSLKSKAWYISWNKMSEEDKEKKRQFSRERATNTWKTMSEEEKKRRENKRINSWFKTYYSIPLQERSARMKHMQSYWWVVSKINKERKSEFEALWHLVEIEFPLNNYFYDLKIWNVLIEINPFPYHNSLWAPWWAKPKWKLYHKDKIKNAIDNWYECLMIRDRDDKNNIISMIKDRNVSLLFKERDEIWTRDMYIEPSTWETKDAKEIFNNFIKENTPTKIYHTQDMSKLWHALCIELWFKIISWSNPTLHKRTLWNRKAYNNVEVYDAWIWTYEWS